MGGTWWMTLIACGLSGGERTETEGPTVASPTEACTSATLGGAGGVLALEEALVTFPPGVLLENSTVELCYEASDDPMVVGRLWSVGPALVPWAGPVTFSLIHDGPGTVQLFVPGADGFHHRAFDATRPQPGAISGSMYRPGTVWAREDLRVLEPYDGNGVAERADILFVVDNSCGMDADQVALVEAFEDFDAALRSAVDDVHIGVTSTDMDGVFGPNGSEGKLRSIQGERWLDADDSPEDARQLFAAMAQMGTTGAAITRGLSAAFHAIEVLGSTDNDGFVRDDASLMVVVVSNEANTTESDDPTLREYIDWTNALKAPPAVASTWAIGIPLAEDYVRAAQQTGGAFFDIDSGDAFGTALDAVVDAVDTDAAGIVLPEPIIEATLEAWWIPPGQEARRIPAADVVYFADTLEVTVDTRDLPVGEVFLLFEVLGG